jgi:isopenicillin-N N-acyltransferase-like protein
VAQSDKNNCSKNFGEEETVRKIKSKRKVKQVEVSGNPYEIGFQYGSACPEIGKMFAITCQALELERDAAISLAPKYIPFIEEYSPDIANEMKGMAEGAKVDLREIVFLNIWYELSLRGLMGCTSFAASGKATSNGELIIGQNLDMTPAWEEMLVLLRIKPKKGPLILAFTITGLLGLLSLNSAGLALNGNMLAYKNLTGFSVGVPHMVWVRRAQSSENIGKAIGAIASAKKTGCAVNTLLGSREGDIIDIEVTPDDLGLLCPQKGFIVHSNHFYTERFKNHDLMGTIYPDSYVRSHRLTTLMEKHWGKVSVDVIKELLSDHNNYPDSICRHVDQEVPLKQQMKTVASIISYPKEQKMFIAHGNPCENEHIEYKL